MAYKLDILPLTEENSQKREKWIIENPKGYIVLVHGICHGCQRHFKMLFFAETECRFLQGSMQVLYSLIHHITCRLEARQALIYQLVSGLTGENGKYNDTKAVHFYPPFFDIFCSPKNYKTASTLTVIG